MAGARCNALAPHLHLAFIDGARRSWGGDKVLFYDGLRVFRRAQVDEEPCTAVRNLESVCVVLDRCVGMKQKRKSARLITFQVIPNVEGAGSDKKKMAGEPDQPERRIVSSFRFPAHIRHSRR